MFIVQAAYLIIALFVFGISTNSGETQNKGAVEESAVEDKWHQDANAMQNATSESVQQVFDRWKEEYPRASMCWVDGQGMLSNQIDIQEGLPAEWSPAYTAKFIKQRYGGDPFTVIAFVGQDETNGFVVLEMPRSEFDPPMAHMYDRYGLIKHRCSIV